MIGGNVSPRARQRPFGGYHSCRYTHRGVQRVAGKTRSARVTTGNCLPLSHKGTEAPSSLHHNEQSHERLKHVRSRRSALQLDLAISSLRHFQVLARLPETFSALGDVTDEARACNELPQRFSITLPPQKALCVHDTPCLLRQLPLSGQEYLTQVTGFEESSVGTWFN